jgi:hypothetical protein
MARRRWLGRGAVGLFADWVVSTDPEHRSLLDAFVRDDRVLGVIVHPQLTRGQASGH